MASMVMSTIPHGSGASPSGRGREVVDRRGPSSSAVATSSSVTAKTAWDNTNPLIISCIVASVGPSSAIHALTVTPGDWSAARSR
jgi:hypothetical protein